MEGIKEIVSSSGITHFVNPKSRHFGAQPLPPGRTQTLCEMHLRNDEKHDRSGLICQVCEKIAGAEE